MVVNRLFHVDFLFNSIHFVELKEYLTELFGDQQRGKAMRVAAEIKKCREAEEKERILRLEATHPYVQFPIVFPSDLWIFEEREFKDPAKVKEFEYTVKKKTIFLKCRRNLPKRRKQKSNFEAIL